MGKVFRLPRPTARAAPREELTKSSGPAPVHRRRTPRQRMTEELRHAERTVRAALRPHRRRGPVIPPVAATPVVPADVLVARLQRDLRNEREQILEPLLRRLKAIGEILTEEHDVPSAVIQRGLGLWEEYLTRLHDLHVSQFRLAGFREDHAERCAVPLIAIEGDPDRGNYRIRAIRAMWSGYHFHVGGYRELLGLILTGEARAELAWEGFEEDYAISCLPTHLTRAGIAQWTDALDRAEREAPALRQRVRRYLEETAAYEGGPRTPLAPAR